ncbi:MAG TPA: BMC domain-containing protein [Actinomycetota bacterium]
MHPAVGLLEFDSIAGGIEAGDAMAKRSPLEVIRAGTVHPGRFLVLVGGLTADVEEALEAGRTVGSVVDELLLPDVHPDVVASIGGARRVEDTGEALGVVETSTVAAVLRAADAGVKAARVTIRELRLADDLGGKGYVLFGGEVSEVETAVEAGQARVGGAAVGSVVIAQLHGEMRENLDADPRFVQRVAGVSKSEGPPSSRPVPPPGDRPRPGTGGTLARPAKPGPAAAKRRRVAARRKGS